MYLQALGGIRGRPLWAWEDAVGRCYEAHDADTDADADSDASNSRRYGKIVEPPLDSNGDRSTRRGARVKTIEVRVL